MQSNTQIESMYKGEYKESCMAAQTRVNTDGHHLRKKWDYTSCKY